MTNDTKYMLWRAVSAGLVTFELFCLGRALGTGFADKQVSGKAAAWYVVFFVSCIGNAVAFVLYRKAKAERWSGHSDGQRIEVEMLAAAAKQQQAERQAAQSSAPAPNASEPTALPPSPPLPLPPAPQQIQPQQTTSEQKKMI